jgi:hypothetical protein
MIASNFLTGTSRTRLLTSMKENIAHGKITRAFQGNAEQEVIGARCTPLARQLLFTAQTGIASPPS